MLIKEQNNSHQSSTVIGANGVLNSSNFIYLVIAIGNLGSF